MNQFDAYLTDYLYENKEVVLDKIGTIRTTASSSSGDREVSADFTFDKKVTTSEGLINYIAGKAGKNKYLIASDIESHFAQVREFINIGKSYEINGIGFIKANKSGVYEFFPYSEANKPVRTSNPTVARSTRNNNRSIIQIISFIIVIAILAGLGWQAYRFFSKKKADINAIPVNNYPDTIANTNLHDTNKTVDSTLQQPVVQSENDTLNVKYIFETTASGLRARTRTEQLKRFGNNAGYDSFVNHDATFYNLYIIKPTKIADTLTVKDSLAKFLQKDIKLEIEPARQ